MKRIRNGLGIGLTCAVVVFWPWVVQAKAAPSKGPQRVELRLAQIEEQILGLQADLGDRQQALEERLGTMASSVEELRRGLESDASERACSVRSDVFQGREETVVTVAGFQLRFVAVDSAGPVVIGLQEPYAKELYRRALEGVTKSLIPTVLRSVPEVSRRVRPFLLQDRPVADNLRLALGLPAHPTKVSLRQAQEVVDSLNQRCGGKLHFDLPTEEELVVAARRIYDHRNDSLKPCHEVAGLAEQGQHAELLAHGWQLTRSLCEPLNGKTVEPCAPGTYVIKGGTRHSDNPLECIAEYRDAVPPTVAAQDTIFRLVLRP